MLCNTQSNTAKRLNELAAIPDALEDDVSTGPEAHGTAAQGVVQTGCKELDHVSFCVLLLSLPFFVAVFFLFVRRKG